jgi:ABC-type multidrug transport system ATPase subunit/ABC-type polysaccharide/polyol phosphate export permease
VNYLRQFIILLERSILINRRDRPYLYGAFLESTCVGMLMAWIFWQLDDSSVGIKSKQGLLYVALSIENFNTMSLLMDRFINEVGFFDREIQEDLYHPAIYLFARTISMIPQFIVQSFIFGSILYFGCNLRLDPKNYFLFITIFFCMMIFVNGICWFCISISRIRSKAEFWSQLQHFFFSITCGFFINFDSLPIYVRWIQQINPIAYAFRILNIDEFHHRDLGQYDGDSVLSSAGINPNAYGKCWWIMLSIIVVYYFLAGIRLTWIRFPPDRSVGSFQINSKDVEEKDEVTAISSEQTIPSNPHRYSRMSSGGSNNSHEDDKGEEEIPVMLDEENMLKEFSYTKEKKKNLTIETNLPSPMKSAPSFTHSQEIHISIKNLDLSVRLPSNETKEILRDISITASPGSLIALMGGSGSGKTSLLNIIANRIPQSIFRKGTTTSNHNQTSITSSSSGYFGKGEILFNGNIPTSKEIKDSIGYVPQFDTLLPGLTVQETLYFHGKLRLPMNVSEWDVDQCVQNVLRNLNLKGCAHVSVGNEYQKGISGGEKRRLSIGIQLLSDPVICLFDEPTTGLDAFAARNVIQILKELCCIEPEAFSSPNRNSLNSLRSFSRIFKRKTMILSIHQPRYDIFQEIDEVILLSRGSLIWSGSTQEMIQHFYDLGYPCPSFVNPADFILDLTSIDVSDTFLFS